MQHDPDKLICVMTPGETSISVPHGGEPTLHCTALWRLGSWRPNNRKIEQRVTGVISLSEFELSKLKVYKVERSIYPSIFRIKQRVQPLCLDLFILREIDWKGRVQV